MPDLEASFLRQIATEPEHALHRLIYADWLEEQGDPRAELLRIQEQLRTTQAPDRAALEQRMHALLAAGVQPLTIRLTSTIRLRLVLIFPGEFVMGSPEVEETHEDDEQQIEVQLTRTFWLAEIPLLQGMWRQLRQDVPWGRERSVPEGEEFPATCITWDHAEEFCAALTRHDRYDGCISPAWKYSLPTEAQWEYACRAGTTTRFHCGDKLRSEFAWFEQPVPDQPCFFSPAQKPANPWGLYDMHGNIWEWCRDYYAPQLPGGRDPEVREHTPVRMRRGGCVGTYFPYCRSAMRGRYEPERAYRGLGFRVALIREGA